jgi:hypothetical protein
MRPKVVGSEKNFSNHYYRNPLDIQRNNNTKSAISTKISSELETNPEDRTVHYPKSVNNLGKYGGNERIQEESILRDNDSSLSSEGNIEEEEISTEQERLGIDEDNFQVLNLAIKLSEENIQILKISRKEDILQSIKEFCTKNNVKSQLIKPIYEKVAQAIKALDTFLSSTMENTGMFKEALEYLTTIEKWKGILDNIDNDELNTSCPDIHSQGKDIFVDKKETILNKTFN